MRRVALLSAEVHSMPAVPAEQYQNAHYPCRCIMWMRCRKLSASSAQLPSTCWRAQTRTGRLSMRQCTLYHPALRLLLQLYPFLRAAEPQSGVCFPQLAVTVPSCMTSVCIYCMAARQMLQGCSVLFGNGMLTAASLMCLQWGGQHASSL